MKKTKESVGMLENGKGLLNLGRESFSSETELLPQQGSRAEMHYTPDKQVAVH